MGASKLTHLILIGYMDGTKKFVADYVIPCFCEEEADVLYTQYTTTKKINSYYTVLKVIHP